MISFGSWKDRVKVLKRETFTLYLACRHPGVPWYAKLLALIVVAYALSPIDLIPDFIPVLGYLDDLVLIPLGLMLDPSHPRGMSSRNAVRNRRKSSEGRPRAGKIAAVDRRDLALTAALVVWMILRARMIDLSPLTLR